MKNRRYGSIKYGDFSITILVNLFLFVISGLAFYIKAFTEGFLFLSVAILSFVNILYPYIETYSINGSIIKIRKILSSYRIGIPNKTIIVITQADVHQPFGYQSYLLKKRLAISILQDLPLDCVIEILHGKYKSQFIYTNSTIEKTMDKNIFVYSCIYTKDIIESVLQVTSGLIIIPESLKDIVAVPNNKIEVYYDIGW